VSAAVVAALKPGQKLVAALCSAAILGALVAGCGNSPEAGSTNGAAGAGNTSGGVERTDNDGGKAGGTPNSHIDKDGEAGKESGS